MSLLGNTALETATKVDAGLTSASQIRNIAVAGRAERAQAEQKVDSVVKYEWFAQSIAASNRGRALMKEITY